MEIRNVHEALNYFLKILKRKGFKIYGIKKENFGRHYGIRAYYESNNYPVKFYLVYQRKWFQSFDKYFNIPDEAVTINLPILHRIIENHYDRIVWCNEEGKLYMIEPKKMLEIATRLKLIRRTKKTGEAVVHLPLVLLDSIT